MPRVLVEPGRSIVGRAGVTLYRVGGVKEIPGVRTYAAVDGGMSDLLRPMLYGAVYEPLLANRADAEPTDTLRLVGKHCESGDVLVAEASLPPVGARRPGVPAGHGRLRCVDGVQLQRGHPARGACSWTAARPPGDAPRDLRRPRGAGRVTVPRPVRIGLLGCGTVGQAVVRTLLEGGATIERASGHRLEVGPILVRDAAQAAAGGGPGAHHHRPRARARRPLGLDRGGGDGRPRSRPSATCARPSGAASRW